IERIEAEALPAWLQQPERAECANDCSTTADLLADQGAYRYLDPSEIAAAEQGLQRAFGRIEPEAIPALAILERQPQTEGAASANDGRGAPEPPAEIEGACRDGIAAAIQRLESAIEKIKAEAIRALPQQPESVVAEQGLESANKRTKAVPDWLWQPERVVR